MQMPRLKVGESTKYVTSPAHRAVHQNSYVLLDNKVILIANVNFKIQEKSRTNRGNILAWNRS